MFSKGVFTKDLKNRPLCRYFFFEFSDEDDCSIWFVQLCDDIGTHYFCLHSFLASDPCGCSQGFLDSKCGIIDANKPYEEPWPRSVCLTLIEMVDYVAFILARALCLDTVTLICHSTI